jgi:hypothetical protein
MRAEEFSSSSGLSVKPLKWRVSDELWAKLEPVHRDPPRRFPVARVGFVIRPGTVSVWVGEPWSW